MDRRTLILRRFGDLSFGLGFMDNGVWVDHAVASARGDDLLAGASPADRDALDAIHTWFACCDGGLALGADAPESHPLLAVAGSVSS
jgi:hypothetical protein